MAKISKEEKQWRAESDARTLADANEIMTDKVRFMAAIKAANKLAKEEKRKLDALNLVVNKRVKTQTKTKSKSVKRPKNTYNVFSKL